MGCQCRGLWYRGPSIQGTPQYRIPSIQGSLNTGSLNTRFPQYKGPSVQGVPQYRGPSIQGSYNTGSLNTRVPQYRGPSIQGSLNTGVPQYKGPTIRGPLIQGALNTGGPQYKGLAIQGVLKTRGLPLQTSSLQRKHRGHPCRGSLIERCPSVQSVPHKELHMLVFNMLSFTSHWRFSYELAWMVCVTLSVHMPTCNIVVTIQGRQQVRTAMCKHTKSCARYKATHNIFQSINARKQWFPKQVDKM